MAITGVHHIVIRVEDIDKGIATYRDVLGLELDRTDENEALGIKQAFFKLPAGGFVEVVAPTSPDSAVGRRRCRNCGGDEGGRRGADRRGWTAGVRAPEVDPRAAAAACETGLTRARRRRGVAGA